MSFTPAVNHPAGDYPVDVVTADFNNDGHLDIVSSDNGTTSVSVLLGNGDGTFQPRLRSEAGGTNDSVAVGDFNEDGKLDLAVGAYATANVMLGNGDGTFQAPSAISVGSDVQSVAVGDFNDDNSLDLAVRSNTYVPGYNNYYYYNYGTNFGHVNVLLGNGNGSFAAPITHNFDGLMADMTVADLNGDGIDDVAATRSDWGSAAILFGDTGGRLQDTANINLNIVPAALAAGDVDSDGDNDLVITQQSWYGSTFTVLRGDGAGGFGPAESYAGAGGNSLALGDFDHDGQLDVAIASSNGSSNVTLVRRHSNGGFAPAETFNAGQYVFSLTASDINSDGWLDIATANYSSNSVSVLMNDRAWSPAAPSLSINDVTITEGNSGSATATFTVTRSGSLAGVATVNYSTANGGALAGSDYVAKSGRLTFANGVSTMQVSVTVNGDVIDEYDQGFYINLSSPTGALITDGQGYGLILDNDATPTVSITPKVSVKEGNKNRTTSLTFTVTLSAPSEKGVSVYYATANGTATTANGDYVAASGYLNFATGVTSKTISIQVIGDNDKELDETFVVNLANVWSVLLGNSQGIGEIQNDDKR